MINYQKYKNIRPRWISKIGGVSVILFSLMLFGCGASNSFQQAGRDKDDSSGKKEDPLKKITGIVAQRKAIYNLNKLQSEELKYNPPTPDDSYFLRRMKNLREMADIEKIERQDRLRADLQAMGKRELFGIVNESTKIEKLQGNKRAALINSGPAYFQDDNGKWKEIEPNFSLYKPKKITEKNYKYASLNNGTKILMAAQSGTVQTISLQKRGEKPLQWGAKKMGAVDQMGQVLWQIDAQKTDGELTKFDWRQRGPKFGEGISNPEDNMSLEQGQSLVETRLLA